MQFNLCVKLYINYLYIYYLSNMKTDLQMNLRKKKNHHSYQHQPYQQIDQYQDYRKTNIKKLSLHILEDNTYYAKLFSKFINQINQNCRQNKKQCNGQKQIKQITVQEKPLNEIKKKIKIQQTNPEIPSKINNLRKISKQISDQKNLQKNQQSPKKINKDLYKLKDQHNHTASKNSIPTQTKQNKSIPQFNFNNLSANYLPMLELSSYYLSLNNANFNQNIDAAVLHLQQPQFGQKLPPYNFSECINMLQHNSFLNMKKPLQKIAQRKLFGRSAFHVAIAYHIHLKKIQNKGKDKINPNQVDPTYFAKKLRQKKTDAENITI